MNAMLFQISFSDYYGRIGHHYPAGKLWDFLTPTEFVIIKIVQPSSIPQSDTYSIDGSSKPLGGIYGPDIHQYTSTFPLILTGRTGWFNHLLWLIHKLLF